MEKSKRLVHCSVENAFFLKRKKKKTMKKNLCTPTNPCTDHFRISTASDNSLYDVKLPQVLQAVVHSLNVLSDRCGLSLRPRDPLTCPVDHEALRGLRPVAHYVSVWVCVCVCVCGCVCVCVGVCVVCMCVCEGKWLTRNTKLVPALQEWICHTVIIITPHYTLLIRAPSFLWRKEKVIFIL